MTPTVTLWYVFWHDQDDWRMEWFLSEREAQEHRAELSGASTPYTLQAYHVPLNKQGICDALNLTAENLRS